MSNNYMEVKAVTNMNRTNSLGSQKSPRNFKSTETVTIQQHDVQPADEFKTKSGIKSSRAFAEE